MFRKHLRAEGSPTVPSDSAVSSYKEQTMSRDQEASLLMWGRPQGEWLPSCPKELSVLNNFVTTGVKITDGRGGWGVSL